MKTNRDGQRGFSLVETLVAVVVLGVGLVGMIHGITAVLEGARIAEQRSRAVLLAVEQMELMRTDTSFASGEYEGDFGDDFPGYGWKSSVVESDAAGLFEITVTVIQAPAGSQLYQLVTLAFVPPEPEPVAPRTTDEASGEAARNGRTP